MVENILLETGINAKKASRILAGLLSAQKDDAIRAIAEQLEKSAQEIIKANEIDLENAVKNGLTSAMQDRLKLDEQRIYDIADSVRDIAELPDPIGILLEGRTLSNGIELTKKTVPLGVVGIIYESRPNVTVDCSVLCLKSGNASILRGGSEAINSNKKLIEVIHKALEIAEIPKDAVQFVEETDRKYANALMELKGYVDVLIPRGGKALINSVVENAKVPVIETGAGVSHTYVDAFAEVEMAVSIVENAKISRPSVCNALETLLVHKDIAERFLEKLLERLSGKVQYKTDNIGKKYLVDSLSATEEDWYCEYNDYIMNVKVVDSMDDAINHIDKYSTHHSEAIVSENYENAQRFLNEVDSAAVYVNASTRFTDGGEFGLGAEIGIATQKLHVRGPMGLAALTSTKYILRGEGQIRE